MATQIRKIQPEDNPHIAKIIRDALEEFGANHPGTVYFDDTTDHLYELFLEEGSVYFIATIDDRIVGGGGIYPTAGLPTGTCELVKMYLHPSARGSGLGSKMIHECIEAAKKRGYDTIYLETMPELKPALKVYAKFGFEYLPGPMGNSGHTGCSLWMKRIIKHPPLHTPG